MKVEITMEKTMRVVMEFEASKEQIEDLKRGKIHFMNKWKKKLKMVMWNMIIQ